MDKEKKDQFIRVGALSGIAFLAVVIITGFSNRGPSGAKKSPASIAHYRLAVTALEANVESLEMGLNAEAEEVDWNHLEELEQQKMIRERVLPPVEKLDRIAEAIPEQPEVAPALSIEDQLAGIVVSGVAWSDQTPLAFIGTNVLRENDRFGDFTVLKIHQNGILLQAANGETAQLNLYETVRRP